MTADSKSPPRLKKVEKRVDLTFKENYELCKFLNERTPQPGETYSSIARDAAVALKIPGLNNDHVKNRFMGLGLKLTPAEVDPAERLRKLEHILTNVIREQVFLLRDLGREPHPDLVAFLES
jgi:hypothetical protein